MKTRTLRKNKKILPHAWSLIETKVKAMPKGNNTTAWKQRTAVREE